MLVVLFAFVLMSGCASIDYPRAHSTSIEKDIHSFSYTADLRATHFIKKGDRYWILTEPAPDAAFSYEDEDDLDISLLSFGGKGEDAGAAAQGTEDLPLTGRASYVLLARELMFRLNEMAYNTRATQDQVMEMYDKVLTIIQNVAKMEAANISHQTKVNLNTGATSSVSLQESSSSSMGATNSKISSTSDQSTSGSGKDSNSSDDSDQDTSGSGKDSNSK
jgi:hypothetical protein